MADAKKSDIVPKLIEDAGALRIASETMELARRTLVEAENQVKDEMAGYQSAYDAAELAIRAHIMAGGSLPSGTHYRIVPVSEKVTETYDQTALAEFDLWSERKAESLNLLIRQYRRIVAVYDGESIAKLVACSDEDHPARERFKRCIKRETKPATTRMVWDKV